MKQVMWIMILAAVVGMTACASKTADNSSQGGVNVQTSEGSTTVDPNGHVNVQAGDSNVDVNGGNVNVQTGDMGVKVENGNVSVQGLDKYLNAGDEDDSSKSDAK
jgi:ferric-dicitrate binding protein FerR (iron transport regulator)